jgi:hypothetical protein
VATPIYREVFVRAFDRADDDPGQANPHPRAAHQPTERELKALWDATSLSIRHSLFTTHALFSITIIDPACGSGHFLLAAARRLAERLAALRAPEGTVRAQDYWHEVLMILVQFTTVAISRRGAGFQAISSISL